MAAVSAAARPEGLRKLAEILLRNRQLTWMLARREISDRYVGQMLGALWAVGQPLLLVAVYLFVFRVVFKTTMAGDGQLPLDFSVYILSGLIPWMALNECLNKSCITITNNANLVKQVVFPLEVLPVKGLLATLFPQAICLGLLIIYTALSSANLPWTYALLPALLILQVLWMAGIGFTLAAIGPFFRDIKELVQVFSTIGVYLIPVVYLPTMVPEMLRPVLYLNPFSHVIWCFQDVCFFGDLRHPWSWGIVAFVGVASCGAGFRLFQRVKPYFGNVL